MRITTTLVYSVTQENEWICHRPTENVLSIRLLYGWKQFSAGDWSVSLRTIDVADDEALKDGKKEHRPAGCIGVHQLQHKHTSLQTVNVASAF